MKWIYLFICFVFLSNCSSYKNNTENGTFYFNLERYPFTLSDIINEKHLFMNAGSRSIAIYNTLFIVDDYFKVDFVDNNAFDEIYICYKMNKSSLASDTFRRRMAFDEEEEETYALLMNDLQYLEYDERELFFQLWSEMDDEERDTFLQEMGFMSWVKKTKEKAVEKAKAVGQKAANIAKDVGKEALNKAQDALVKAKAIGEKALDKAKDAEKSALSKAKDALDKAKEIGAKAKGFGEKAWDKTRENAPGLWDKTKQLGGSAWDKTKEVGENAWDKTVQHAPSLWDKTKQIGGSAWDKTKEVGENAWDKTRQHVPNAWDQTKQFTKDFSENAWDQMQYHGGKALDKTKEFGGNAWDQMRQHAPNAWDKTMQFGDNTWDKIKYHGENALDKTMQFGGSTLDKMREHGHNLLDNRGEPAPHMQYDGAQRPYPQGPYHVQPPYPVGQNEQQMHDILAIREQHKKEQQEQHEQHRKHFTKHVNDLKQDILDEMKNGFRKNDERTMLLQKLRDIKRQQNALELRHKLVSERKKEREQLSQHMNILKKQQVRETRKRRKQRTALIKTESKLRRKEHKEFMKQLMNGLRGFLVAYNKIKDPDSTPPLELQQPPLMPPMPPMQRRRSLTAAVPYHDFYVQSISKCVAENDFKVCIAYDMDHDMFLFDVITEKEEHNNRSMKMKHDIKSNDFVSYKYEVKWNHAMHDNKCVALRVIPHDICFEGKMNDDFTIHLNDLEGKDTKQSQNFVIDWMENEEWDKIVDIQNKKYLQKCVNINVANLCLTHDEDSLLFIELILKI